MNLIEPQRGHHLLTALNTIVYNSPTLTKLVPILADVFVFAYPTILLIWYCTGIIKKNRDLKSDALTVLFGAIYTTIINIGFQQILHKDRPIFSGDNSIHLILKDLPTASFPSDHAAVSMIFALMVGLIAWRNNNKGLKFLSILLVLISVIMSISRVAVGVHWPTDIIAGWGVAVVIASLLSLDSIRSLQQKYINEPIIKLQEWIFTSVGIKG